MNWRAIICWIKNHDYRRDGGTLIEVISSKTKTCKRCGMTIPAGSIEQLIPDKIFKLFMEEPRLKTFPTSEFMKKGDKDGV